MVSLLADVAYEGARSVSGPFLSALGAGAGIIGLTAGLGEFFGYALRFLSGYLADRTARYWFFTIAGYALVLAVPLLALAGRWEAAAGLIILERMGKALRAPSRDTILSYSTSVVGRGLGFGLHETLDQAGALLGPVLFSMVLFFRGGYRAGFALLAIPAFSALLVLLVARSKVPEPRRLENSRDCPGKTGEKAEKLPRLFWIYTFFIFVSVAGFANFPLIAYHLKIKGLATAGRIPLLYALAMAVDGGAALLIGKSYDRFGLRSLIMIPLLTVLIPFFAFSRSYTLVAVGMILWGLTMGVHETIMRAAIADLTPAGRRGTAYGIFNMAYGAAWLTGGVAMGIIYQVSVIWIMFFTAALEIISLPLFIFFMIETK